MSKKLFVLTAAALALGAGTMAHAQALRADRVVPTNFARPLFVTAPPGDTSRLFVVEQRGSGGVSNRADIRIIDLTTSPPTVRATPFLSIVGVSTGSEQGLLGLAFSPNYASDGFFWVKFTNAGGTSVVARYQVSSSDPNVANPASATTILTVAQPFSNHNGGWIGFGPDNLLYIALGDGGSGNDPQGRSLQLNTLLGKTLRIEVVNAAASGGTYTVPPGNPLIGTAGALPEIWAWGLRNHWRNSFDRLTGDFWMGDVGQVAREEIHVQPAGVGGLNFGWRCFEGNIATPGVVNSGNLQWPGGPPCPTLAAAQAPGSGWTFPVIDYDRSGGRCSVTGGYVYRGVSMPWLRGTYFYADYCSGQVYNFRYQGSPNPPITEITSQLTGATGFGIVSFGQDANGELYIVSQGNNGVWRINPRCPANCDGSTSAPVLTPSDFVCFLNAFRNGDLYANFDGSTGTPVLTPSDFVAYLNAFRTGCP